MVLAQSIGSPRCGNTSGFGGKPDSSSKAPGRSNRTGPCNLMPRARWHSLSCRTRKSVSAVHTHHEYEAHAGHRRPLRKTLLTAATIVTRSFLIDATIGLRRGLRRSTPMDTSGSLRFVLSGAGINTFGSFIDTKLRKQRGTSKSAALVLLRHKSTSRFQRNGTCSRGSREAEDPINRAPRRETVSPWHLPHASVTCAGPFSNFQSIREIP
jgi:hypothetical protein